MGRRGAVAGAGDGPARWGTARLAEGRRGSLGLVGARWGWGGCWDLTGVAGGLTFRGFAECSTPWDRQEADDGHRDVV